MAHPVSARLSNEPYSAAAGRRFGLTVGAAFVVLAVVGRWRGHSTTFAVLGALGLLLIVNGLVLPTRLRTIERGWMTLATAISRVTTPLFLGLAYFIVLTPVGLLRRLFAGSALVHKSGPHGYWASRRQTPRSSLDRQF